jgi:hypothetical protein
MRSWSPKSRKYWGYKPNNDSDTKNQEDQDPDYDERPPMPWEPQDTTEDSTVYLNGVESGDAYFGNTSEEPNGVINKDIPSSLGTKGKSLIDHIRENPPADLDPKKYVENLLKSVNSKIIAVQDNAIHRFVPLDGLDYAPDLFDLDLSNFHFANIRSEDPKPWYGNFVGPGPDKHSSETGLIPINIIDAVAMAHDNEYFFARATGVKDALLNDSSRVLRADRVLVQMASQVMKMFINQEKDIFTKVPVNFETYLVALSIYIVFSEIIKEKEDGIIPIMYNGMNDIAGRLLSELKQIPQKLKSDFRNFENYRWYE